MSLNSLGLDKAKLGKEIEALNVLLANYQTYYQNLRGVHWNIKGKRFFELHVKFEDLYTAAQEQVDEIAERILTLGGVPYHTFASYVKHATVPVGENVFDDDKTVRLVIDSISELLRVERPLLDLSDELNDEGTNTLISDLVVEQEKNVWMLKSYLNEAI
ncbi:starvation-inducible DNA-binding protein [Capnocytophaga haemolytica]|jgi:metalloregulation DNA-binding stress protein|uniref:DNA starvation/stationary phase protection protein n=1 Tax=Capnocytophaga haemolytica TaxID=45243 RepID=A0AAX2H0Z0_9FLAO|nr:Dps family protein [Capnocytophaga haemolytica]AMD86044.1 DNA starvation/stationary phase protection protein [Capnocytophaga haemolytica]SFO16252.1 starvation-inducible DNA-binding protein [Capnocytophaga haemolytica]SNV14578.1 DNA starvation/stationary phase protection protein Dps [Capnocytophaga haemolytica]